MSKKQAYRVVGKQQRKDQLQECWQQRNKKQINKRTNEGLRKQEKGKKACNYRGSRTNPAAPVMAGPLFLQIIRFIFAVFIFITSVLGIPLLTASSS